MDYMEKFGLVVAAVLLFSFGGRGPVSVNADATVTGSVFCDQCKDGGRSIFDYPLYGAKVAMSCPGTDGMLTAYKEESTDGMGIYTIRLGSSPVDLRQCYARVVRGPSGCDAEVGPAQGLNLTFNMFGMKMYAVNPLLSQPHQPMALCPRAPARPRPILSPPTVPPLVPPPAVGSRLPVIPIPSMKASACSFDKWTMPEHKCYWKVVSPDTKIAVAFGPIAAAKYGFSMTLWEGIHGKGDVYRTLLREATTSLLNSYNSLAFSYPTLTVINHMSTALLGSPRQALMTTLRFKRANNGVSRSATVPCTFSTCS